MDLDIAGKTGIVTGASIGIGAGIALGLGREGVKLALVARRAPLLEETARQIVEAGGPAPEIIECDLQPDGAAESLAEEAMRRLGRVDIIVNNAGGSRFVQLDAPEDEYTWAMTMNFIRHRQLTHALLPQMVARKWGRIVNISGKSEPSGYTPTSFAKAALHSWAKSLSNQVGKDGITINSIPPGKIMSEQIRQKYTTERRQKQAANDIPVGEYGKPEDIANLVCFLSSPLARYITGTVIPVDGGFRKYAF